MFCMGDTQDPTYPITVHLVSCEKDFLSVRRHWKKWRKVCLGFEPDLRSLITVHLLLRWKETPGAAHIHKAEGERAANLCKKY